MPIREKTHRLPRESYRGQITVAFTVCVAGRQTIFDRADRVHPLKDLLAARSKAHFCDVMLYCFMPDHLHIILCGASADADADADAWKAITDFKQHSGYFLSKNKGLYANATWQKDFYDHIIRVNEDLGA